MTSSAALITALIALEFITHTYIESDLDDHIVSNELMKHLGMISCQMETMILGVITATRVHKVLDLDRDSVTKNTPSATD